MEQKRVTLYKRIGLMAGAITGMAAVLALLWQVGTWTETRPVVLKEFNTFQTQEFKVLKQEVGLNREYILLRQFESLMAKKRHGKITAEQHRKLCIVAAQLKFQVQGCK